MKLTGLTPNLVTPDVNRSVAFYRDVLGFAVKVFVPDAPPHVFAWLERDDVNIFVNDAATVAKESPDATTFVPGRSGVAMFIAMEGVRDLWASLEGRATVVMPLRDQWYGMTEFSVVDPDGYVVTFAERKAPSSE